jgi:glycosyltransferase EpsE
MDSIESPLISVIMPAYNTEQFIGEAIQSILDQTYIHFELLICDDGSTDKTYEIAKQCASIDSRIKLFRNKKNIGNLRTTNFLLDNCKGDFIAVQDADDISHFKRFERCMDIFMEQEDIQIIGTNYCITDENLTPISCGLLPLDDYKIKEAMDREVAPMLYASIIVKRSLVLEVGNFRSFFNRKGFADLDWLSRCIEQGKCMNLKDVLYFYRKHSTQFTQGKPIKNFYFRHIHLLLVQAHIHRIQGKEDFLETGNTHHMKKKIAEHYHYDSKRSYWNNQKFLGVKKMIYAIKLNNNVIYWKDLFYMIRNFWKPMN